MGRGGAVAAGLVLLVLVTGVAWAAGALDGLTDDWSSGDQLASNGIVLFGKKAVGRLCFRVDVDLLFNSPPDAVDDGFMVNEDSSNNVLAVLGNDSDPETGPLTVTGIGAPDQGGTATTDGTTITYTPAADFAGVETFTYTIADGNGGMDSATVTVTVNEVNDDPDAVDDAFMVDEDTSNNLLDGLANDTDAPDTGETLTITGVGATDQGGTATTDGSTIAYTPAANFAGVETFTYTISDGNGGTDTATVTVTVNDANDDPPACAADMPTTDEDSSTIVGVLSNDSDPDPGETATLTVLSVDTTGTTGMVTNNGTDVTYDPNGQFESLGSTDSTTDAFTYTAQDADGLTCMATVTVTIDGVNDVPMADDESFDFACNLEGVVESNPGQAAAATGSVFRTIATTCCSATATPRAASRSSRPTA